MSCGLGAVILIFMLVKYHVGDSPIESDLLTADIERLQLQQQELQQTLAELQNTSQSEAEKIARLRAKLALLQQTLNQKELSLDKKKAQLAALKKDISERPIAQKEDLVEDDRGGEEDYLLGLKVEGRRIGVLIDSSASMTDEPLVDIIKRKNGSATEKKRGPKWQRTRKVVRWLLARVPKTSELMVVSYNTSVKPLAHANWTRVDTSTELQALYREMDALVPEGATNLQKGLQEIGRLGATDLYLITDGLPTAGESRYASLNPFASCSSLLGKSSTISGECRVKLFRQTIKDSAPAGAKINVILLPIEGDPDAANEYWAWAASTGGLVISPALNWP